MAKHTKRHKMKTVNYYGFAVRETRPDYYVADRLLNGHRMRKGFKDLAGAKLWCQQKDIELKNKGAESLQISDAQRVELTELHAKIKGRNITLAECVDFWLLKNPDNTTGETWSDTAARYVQSMKDANRRPTSIRDKEIKLALIGEEVGKVLMRTIDDNDLKTAVNKITEQKRWTPNTRHAYENAGKTLIRFFNNQSKRMVVQHDDKTPETWSIEFIKKILSNSEEVTPEITAGLAIMIFAGLRPTEAMRLDWSQVKFDEKIIHLSGTQTKTRKPRNIEISDNLMQWLKAYQSEGSVLPTQTRYRTLREKLMHTVQLEKWIPDTPRHTCATFMYAKHNGDYVTRNLGHSINVMLKHYAGHPPTPKQLEAFWKIAPVDKL